MKNIIKVMMAIACLSLGSVLQADVKLPALISDNMVLQDNKQVPLWGMADPGEKVTVSFAGQSVSTTADATGKWQVNLTPLAADTVGSMTVEGRNKISIANVLVGTVWVCSGQSNMEMRIGAANNAAAEIAKANYPKIRLFLVKKKASIQPQTDVEGRWVDRPTVRALPATESA